MYGGLDDSVYGGLYGQDWMSVHMDICGILGKRWGVQCGKNFDLEFVNLFQCPVCQGTDIDGRFSCYCLFKALILWVRKYLGLFLSSCLHMPGSWPGG